jgi:hypothetical protein
MRAAMFPHRFSVQNLIHGTDALQRLKSIKSHAMPVLWKRYRAVVIAAFATLA